MQPLNKGCEICMTVKGGVWVWKLALCPSTWDPSCPELSATRPESRLQKKGHENYPKAPPGALTQEKVGGFPKDEAETTVCQGHGFIPTLISHSLAYRGHWCSNPAPRPQKGHHQLVLLLWSHKTELCQEARGEAETNKGSVCGDAQWREPPQGKASWENQPDTIHEAVFHTLIQEVSQVLPVGTHSSRARTYGLWGEGVGGIPVWRRPESQAPKTFPHSFLTAYLGHRSLT